MKLVAFSIATWIASIALALTAMSAKAIAQTPVAHWTFDEYLNDYTQTTISDTQTAGGISDAVWADDNTNGLSYTRGMIGGAVRLSGTTSDFFQIASIPEIDNTIALPDIDPATPGTGITVSAWVYSFGTGASYQGVLMSNDVTDRLSATPDIDDPGENWGLAYQNSNDSFDARVSGTGQASAAGSVPPGQWHHIAMVWGADITTVNDFVVPRRTYLDGVQVGFTSSTGVAKIISSGSWRIGSENLNRQFVGLLDDLAVYGSALTTAEVAAITAAGNSGTNASGMATADVLAGDVDGLNDVTIADFNIIRDNLTKSVSARNLGDLDGNRKVDLDDFQEWLEAAGEELRAEALASFNPLTVPEPSTSVLVGLTLTAGTLGLRRSRKRRFFTIAAIATLMCSVAGGQAFAQQLKLQVERQTGNLSLTGVDAGVVDFAAYEVRSQRGTLDIASWNGIRDTEADWVVFGTPGANSAAEANSNGNPTAGSVVNNTVSFGLGSAYDPSAVLVAASLGEDVEAGDLSLVYYNQITNLTLNGVVEFVGEKIFNNIGITVDLADGKAYLENESPNDLTITGYTIESALGLLNVGAGYTGLGGTFQNGPAAPDGFGLGAIDFTGTGQLFTSSMAANTLGVDLGVVVGSDAASLFFANGDLTFRFILEGFGDVNQRAGFVKYINVPAPIAGDFDEDGDVDGRDFMAWQRGQSPDPLSAEDLEDWQTNYGTSVGSPLAAVSAIPEPTSALLLVVILFGGALGPRKVGRTQ